MAKRDPAKTARNKRIKDMSKQLRDLLPTVLADTGFKDEASLNAKIGGKADEFIDLKNEVIHSPTDYAAKYCAGFKKHLGRKGFFKSSYDELYESLNGSKAGQQYMMLFLERSYLKHFEELSKHRPKVEEAAIWIGQNAADYGLLVTPRFSRGDWENDQSEIRHFKPKYWSIGHVMKTGLVVPGTKKVLTFDSVEQYLDFFEVVIVRHSKSKYQIEIAERYREFVLAAEDPLSVPLLIPELRHGGRDAKHRYRLDFCIIDSTTLERIGFEFSPSSSHTAITATKSKTQKQINEEVAANFAKEMDKHKAYFKKFGIFVFIYTDKDLADMAAVFDDIAKLLTPAETQQQLNFHVLDSFFDNK
ncbi:hypothetical protein AB8A05_05940 [Tardiphaga sp. 538_B7_N1_4]|jgi:hypothetical protein|uniref:hypothetical protein n=1 Tax=Tardiphaga sp. 538_B7_N1_4 TaxID=3240778 RepID=UPI003F21AB30